MKIDQIPSPHAARQAANAEPSERHSADVVARAEASAATAPRRSKLQLQCSDGSLFDVTHEEAMMSSTLWMLLQDVSDRRKKVTVRHHTIPIFDVPSASVELALYFCRCLYKQQVEGVESAMADWEAVFYNLDSKMLCDLAKVASNLDIQPLVDITCRSIAQIMSATEAAHEIRQKFGLEDGPELRNGMAGFDFDMFNSLDHDLSTDEYELVEFDQPSVDELVDFINGDSGKPGNGGGSKMPSKNTADGVVADPNGANTSKKKKKKKKAKKKAPSSSASLQASDQDGNEEDEGGDGDGEDGDVGADSKPTSAGTALSARELLQKVRLAQQNPSAVFPESEFEDDEDKELDEQIEMFRLALESAHLESKPKLKPRVQFTPQDVFRNRNRPMDAYRESARLSTATIS